MKFACFCPLSGTRQLFLPAFTAATAENKYLNNNSNFACSTIVATTMGKETGSGRGEVLQSKIIKFYG